MRASIAGVFAITSLVAAGDLGAQVLRRQALRPPVLVAIYELRDSVPQLALVLKSVASYPTLQWQIDLKADFSAAGIRVDLLDVYEEGPFVQFMMGPAHASLPLRIVDGTHRVVLTIPAEGVADTLTLRLDSLSIKLSGGSSAAFRVAAQAARIPRQSAYLTCTGADCADLMSRLPNQLSALAIGHRLLTNPYYSPWEQPTGPEYSAARQLILGGMSDARLRQLLEFLGAATVGKGTSPSVVVWTWDGQGFGCYNGRCSSL